MVLKKCSSERWGREKRFYVEPLCDWSVDKVTSMCSMFYGASAFNQPLCDWSVDNVTSMCWMFYGASAFNQPLGDWSVDNSTNRSATGVSTRSRI